MKLAEAGIETTDSTVVVGVVDTGVVEVTLGFVVDCVNPVVGDSVGRGVTVCSVVGILPVPVVKVLVDSVREEVGVGLLLDVETLVGVVVTDDVAVLEVLSENPVPVTLGGVALVCVVSVVCEGVDAVIPVVTVVNVGPDVSLTVGVAVLGLTDEPPVLVLDAV